jgi:DNA-binding LacI/PurR family transcriptional regulator
VSRATVSNILNGNDERFPAATRERVLLAAEELKYRPSLAGRSLASGRSDTVVILLPNSTFASNLQDAVDEVVAGTRQIAGNVVVRFAGSTISATRDAIVTLRPLAVVDLGVLSTDDRAWLEGLGIAITRFTGDPGEDPDFGITRLQATRLLINGPRGLWCAALSDGRGDPYGPSRLTALQAFCAEQSLSEPGAIAVPLALEGAKTALRPVLDTGPAGVACYNDDVAIALLAAARELGAVVPAELAVVGVDRTAIGQLWSPRLTTVDTDFRSLVEALTADLRVRLGTMPAQDAPPIRTHFTIVDGETA